MIARGFKSVIWVAAVGSAALGCYMVSLRVATERNELAKVERQIVEARRDIRSLQTELGTRGRMTQLEQWNAEVLALSAPSSAQFLKDEFTLARLYRNDPTVADRSAEVRLASADTAEPRPVEAARPSPAPVVQAVAEPAPSQPPMIHRASFTPADASARAKPASGEGNDPAAKPAKPAAQRTALATPAKPSPAAAKPAAKPSKPAAERTASADQPKPDRLASRSIARPAKPEPARAPAPKPVREAAATVRAPGTKGGGGR